MQTGLLRSMLQAFKCWEPSLDLSRGLFPGMLQNLQTRRILCYYFLMLPQSIFEFIHESWGHTRARSLPSLLKSHRTYQLTPRRLPGLSKSPYMGCTWLSYLILEPVRNVSVYVSLALGLFEPLGAYVGSTHLVIVHSIRNSYYVFRQCSLFPRLLWLDPWDLWSFISQLCHMPILKDILSQTIS